MNCKRARGALLLGPALLAATLLAGCGVKNDPIAPATGQTPAAANPAQPVPADVAAPATASRSSLNPAQRNEEPVFAGTTRIQASDNDGNADTTIIAPAEVTRNKTASGRSFILDPLLN